MNDTNLKYICFVENGNKNGQFKKIDCTCEDTPYTKEYGSFIDL